MARTQKCMRCKTYFTGPACPRCDYSSQMPFARRSRRWAPFHTGHNKAADSEIRIIQPPYRPTDPCE